MFCIYSVSVKLPPKHYPLGHELRARHLELDCSMGNWVEEEERGFQKKEKAVLEMPAHELNCCFAAKMAA